MFSDAYIKLMEKVEVNIKSLSADVPSLGAFLLHDENEVDHSWNKYEVEGGNYKAKNLGNYGCFAVALGIGSSDTIFKEHQHDDCVEWLIVVKGSILVSLGDLSVDLHPKDCMEIAEGMPHRVIFLEDSEVLAITVPAADGFPD